MSDREIINAKQGIPMWWKPNIAFLKEEWINHPDLSKFRNKKSTQRKAPNIQISGPSSNLECMYHIYSTCMCQK